jgi:predicted Zn finger-like uncharacterized protein
MPMMTRCPQCGTTFRITTDQLVSRQGKVRCGQCSHVFVALQSLVHVRDRLAQTQSNPIIPLDAQPQPTDPATTSPPQVLEEAHPEGVLVASPDAAEDPSAPLEQLPLPPPKRARRPWFSALGAGLGVIALGAQATYAYRDQIAARWPESKPHLSQLCVQLNCKIEPVLDPQAIRIETSDLAFDPTNKQTLTLTTLLRNRTETPQTLPHLEVTLTDNADKPLLRRVLRPQEYAGALSNTPLAPNGELPVRLSLEAGIAGANGYKLYTFYP